MRGRWWLPLPRPGSAGRWDPGAPLPRAGQRGAGSAGRAALPGMLWAAAPWPQPEPLPLPPLPALQARQERAAGQCPAAQPGTSNSETVAPRLWWPVRPPSVRRRVSLRDSPSWGCVLYGCAAFTVFLEVWLFVVVGVFFHFLKAEFASNGKQIAKGSNNGIPLLFPCQH